MITAFSIVRRLPSAGTGPAGSGLGLDIPQHVGAIVADQHVALVRSDGGEKLVYELADQAPVLLDIVSAGRKATEEAVGNNALEPDLQARGALFRAGLGQELAHPRPVDDAFALVVLLGRQPTRRHRHAMA